jgi:hemerythrin-like domain-containing protein
MQVKMMSITSFNTSPAAAMPSNIHAFSQCHEGLLSQIRDLKRLPLIENDKEKSEIAGRIYKHLNRSLEEHHQEEEHALFSLVRNCAITNQDQMLLAETYIQRLTHEHQLIELMWKQISPALKEISKGKDPQFDSILAERLCDLYEAHAQFEEQTFLPLAETVLGPHGLATLGYAIHNHHNKNDANIAHYV